MATLADLSQALQQGNTPKTKELVQKALDEKVSVKDVLEQGLIAGMGVIGRKFKNNEVYVPEVLIAARAMNAGMEVLEPLLADSGVKPVASVCLGTVKGDLHDIGKNLLAMMLRGGGFKIVDAGIDVPAEKFISLLKEQDCQILALSALLTTTMPEMANIINAVKEAGLDGKVKVIIGGAPITQNYADEIGANGYAPDAGSAVDVCKELVGAN